MSDGLSLSIFTIEVDWKPVIAFACKKQTEAEAICFDERIRAKLSSARSNGKPLCENVAILRVRLAHADERAIYRERFASRLNDTVLKMTYLVELDEPEAN